MDKIVRILMFFCLSGIVLNCKKNNPKPDNTNPFEQWKFEGETSDRPGPGFSWRLTTDKPTDTLILPETVCFTSIRRVSIQEK
jgi:hypothetical protein